MVGEERTVDQAIHQFRALGGGVGAKKATRFLGRRHDTHEVEVHAPHEFRIRRLRRGLDVVTVPLAGDKGIDEAAGVGLRVSTRNLK